MQLSVSWGFALCTENRHQQHHFKLVNHLKKRKKKRLIHSILYDNIIMQNNVY